MERMEEKEFWVVLESADISREFHGYEGILNLVSLALDSMAEHAKYTKEFDKKRSKTIYEYLNKMDYYKR